MEKTIWRTPIILEMQERKIQAMLHPLRLTHAQKVQKKQSEQQSGEMENALFMQNRLQMESQKKDA